MGFFENLFQSKKVECPRCLGKGDVDLEDLKRLGMELKWATGPCAYCQGKGEVSEKMKSRIAVDCTYLTHDISAVERRRLINKDADALRRAEYYEASVENQIKQIVYLYEEGKMKPNEIMEFFFLNETEQDDLEESKSEFLDYVNRVIQLKVNTV